jgi:hypothetical protein
MLLHIPLALFILMAILFPTMVRGHFSATFRTSMSSISQSEITTLSLFCFLIISSWSSDWGNSEHTQGCSSFSSNQGGRCHFLFCFGSRSHSATRKARRKSLFRGWLAAHHLWGCWCKFGFRPLVLRF